MDVARPRHQGPDTVEVNQIGAVCAQKPKGRQEALQPIQRCVQPVRAVVPMNEAAAIPGFNEPDGVGRQRQVVVGGGNEDPGDGCEMRGRRCTSVQRVGGRAVEPLQPRPDAQDGLLDARGRQRLHEVVSGVDLERGRGVVGIPRGEHDGRPGAGTPIRAQPRPPRHFNAIDVRQAHVEAQQVRLRAVERRQDLGSGRAFADGADLAGFEEGAEMPARARLVIGDQGAQHRRRGGGAIAHNVMVHGVIVLSRPLAPLTASPSARSGRVLRRAYTPRRDGDNRQADRGKRPAAGQRQHPQARRRSPEYGQAQPDAGQPPARLPGRRHRPPKPCAVVDHGQVEKRPGHASLDANPAAGRTPGDPMPDRVLDQRLQHHRWDERPQRLRGARDLEAESTAHAGPFHTHEGEHESEFFGKRHEWPRVSDLVPQVRGDMRQEIFSRLRAPA